ncbi:hypothetical protein MHYP_G00169160 [Metynnis hypsauchen]
MLTSVEEEQLQSHEKSTCCLCWFSSHVDVQVKVGCKGSTSLTPVNKWISGRSGILDLLEPEDLGRPKFCHRRCAGRHRCMPDYLTVQTVLPMLRSSFPGVDAGAEQCFGSGFLIPAVVLEE